MWHSLGREFFFYRESHLLTLSPPSDLCSNVIFSMRPSWTIIFKVVTPQQSISLYPTLFLYSSYIIRHSEYIYIYIFLFLPRPPLQQPQESLPAPSAGQVWGPTSQATGPPGSARGFQKAAARPPAGCTPVTHYCAPSSKQGTVPGPPSPDPSSPTGPCTLGRSPSSRAGPTGGSGLRLGRLWGRGPVAPAPWRAACLSRNRGEASAVVWDSGAGLFLMPSQGAMPTQGTGQRSSCWWP